MSNKRTAKSKTTAAVLSWGTTAVSVFAILAIPDDPTTKVDDAFGLTAAGLLVLGPSAGHWYVGEGMTTGLALRLTGAAIFTGLVLGDPEERSLASGELTAGAVGAMLYYPNDTIQHAGVVVGAHGIAAHAYSGHGRGHPGHMSRARLTQSLSAVTAACLVVHRKAFPCPIDFETYRITAAYHGLGKRLRYYIDGLIQFAPFPSSM